MSQEQEDRAKNARTSYWWGVGGLLGLSAFAVYDLFFGPYALNGYVLMVVFLNLVVFGFRARYVRRNKDVLFSEENYRAAEQAANAERVALYAFIVIFGAWLVGIIAEIWVDVDDSVGDVGKNVGVLILVAPVVTYLTSGYGKFRDIVREDEKVRLQGHQ